MTYKQFIDKYNIRFMTKKVLFRDDDYSEWDKKASHYQYILETDKGVINGTYSMGSAHKNKPTVIDVLNCLNMDTNDIGSFQDFVGMFGYDTDSLKAHNIYEACLKEYKQLVSMVGYEGVKELHGIESL